MNNLKLIKVDLAVIESLAQSLLVHEFFRHQLDSQVQTIIDKVNRIKTYLDVESMDKNEAFDLHNEKHIEDQLNKDNLFPPVKQIPPLPVENQKIVANDLLTNDEIIRKKEFDDMISRATGKI